MTTTTATERRIWIGSLADYNNGDLLGEWVDVDGKDGDELQAEAARILATSRQPYAEEFAIFDHEGFGRLIEEYTPLRDVAELSAVMDGIYDEAAFLAWIDYQGKDDLPQDISDYAERFEQQYCGEMSGEEYAEQFAEETGQLLNVPEELAYYIDWKLYFDHTMRNWGYTEHDGYVFSPAR
jgi:hypothetical protein